MWRYSTGPLRLVVDQVCLVPDVPSFFEAIATWDQRHFFPILIDEPAWTLPFLRAFRPARVVRYNTRAREHRGDRRAASTVRPGFRARRRTDSPSGRRRWRPWRGPGRTTRRQMVGSRRPVHRRRDWGRLRRAWCCPAPDSPMLAGAVALAAGRFQPMVRLEPSMWSLDEPGDAGRVYRFGDVLTLRPGIAIRATARGPRRAPSRPATIGSATTAIS